MKPCDNPDGSRSAGPWLYNADPSDEHPFTERWTRDIGTGTPLVVFGYGNEWWWGFMPYDRRGSFVSRAGAMSAADACLVDGGYTLTGGIPDGVPELRLSAIERKTTCAKCGASIVEYSKLTGLLPDEVDGDRHATHHWRACELHAALRAKTAPAPASAVPTLDRSRAGVTITPIANDGLPHVDGFVMERSTEDFIHACRTELPYAEGAAHTRPELVVVLRDAVRLARALEARDKTRVALPFEPVVVPARERRRICAVTDAIFKGREVRFKSDDLDKITVDHVQVGHCDFLGVNGPAQVPASLLHGVDLNLSTALPNQEISVVVENHADVRQTVRVVMFGEVPTDDDYRRHNYRPR